MPAKISIIYDPDDSCGRVVHNPHQGNNPNSGKAFAAPVYNERIDAQVKAMAANAKKKLLVTDADGRLTIETDSMSQTNKSKRKAPVVDTMATKKFEILRDKCAKAKSLYVDEEFPANATSLGNIDGLDMAKVEWKRPLEIDRNADFIKNEIDRFDIKQGHLGNCWLLAVISSITNYPRLLNHVVSLDQKITGNASYAGIFRFRFWQFGKWIDIIVDDLLPVHKGTNKLVFMHSRDEGEFWSPLLEKAYAKLNKSYANLSGGLQAEAMEDFTGGMCETVNLKEPPEGLLEDMALYCKTCSLMGVSSVSAVIEERTQTGLVKGHAYSVTGVDWVQYKGTKQWLVRCRNPWGNAVEWNGSFSDNAKEWKDVSDADKKRLKVTFSDDGEFWMTWQDFLSQWSSLEICHLGSASLDNKENTKDKARLEENIFIGEWVKNVSAGGCINSLKTTFAMNPQYRVSISDSKNSEFLLLGLMQKDVRSKTGGDYLSIGFILYQVDATCTEQLDKRYLQTHKHKIMSKFCFSRETVMKVKLEPGNYVVIPSTFEPGHECKFIFRCMSMVPIGNEELDVRTREISIPEDISRSINASKTGQEEDKKVEELFKKYQDRDKCINCRNLMDIFNATSLRKVKNFAGFNMEIVRSMLASIDDDISGKLAWVEFKKLWEDCEVWRFIYEKVDENKSGMMEASEMRDAIAMAGFAISNQVFEAIVKRYTQPETGQIVFEDYILCMSRLANNVQNMSYQEQTTTGHRLFTEEDYMRYAMYI